MSAFCEIISLKGRTYLEGATRRRQGCSGLLRGLCTSMTTIFGKNGFQIRVDKECTSTYIDRIYKEEVRHEEYRD